MAFFCIHCKSEIDPKFKACPFCGEAITDFLRRYLETPIDGKYQILSRLGVGGMGEVYKVLHIHLNAIRVIKLMRAQIAGDSGATERFLREARLATKINHPSVATLFDFSSEDSGWHYIVFEFIEGINLHELIDQRGPLSPRYAAKLAAQALHGLDAIHRAGIVHRDISPENLMITHDSSGYGAADGREPGEERVKIIDLGIAKQWDTEDNKTKTGMFVGKWKYCSPEHLGMLQAGERIDGRADLYSFGIVLYEMLTGVPPFQADTPHAYLMMHSSERPRAMREVNPGVTAPPELEAIIQRALEKDRNKRFATAREFAQAIERIAPTLSDAAGAPPPLPLEAEVTNEATRVVPRFAPDAATVLSIAQDAPTVATARPVVEEPAAPVKASFPRLVPVAIMVIAVAVAGWLLMNRNVPAPAPAPAAKTETATTVPAAAAHLGINAYPWANVTSIRNLDNGQNVELRAPLVTPAPIELAPGRYEVTLSNPNYSAEITRTVAVEAGRDEMLNVQFSDPRNAKLPDFGGTP
jgi:serine/threonine protein kinase